MKHQSAEIVGRRILMAGAASSSTESLTVIGDPLDDQITVSRNAFDNLLVSGGAAALLGRDVPAEVAAVAIPSTDKDDDIHISRHTS